jgi:sulfite reductase beta subunit-like hemoprotein
MSDYNDTPARPVSIFVVAFVVAVLASFLYLVKRSYAPVGVSPQNAAAEKLPKELEWRATAAARRAALKSHREDEAKKATGYGWVDQKAGLVRLPLDRAVQLTAAELGGKK